MNINVISIFPEILDSSFKGLTGKALEKNIAKLKLIDLKEFSNNDYGSIDDAPYGGGEGMVIGVEPLEKSLKTVKKPGHIIYLTPQGKVFNQTKAVDLSKYKNLTFVCGRYEGIDQRIVNSLVDEEISIGDFILSGGEIPALAVFDSIIRNIEGFLVDNESLLEESFNENLLEYPHFTRPEEMSLGKVPEELLSGNHERIEIWRKKQSLGYTALNRMDLIKNKKLDKNEKSLI